LDFRFWILDWGTKNASSILDLRIIEWRESFVIRRNGMSRIQSIRALGFSSDNLKSKIENLKWVGIVAIGVTFAMCGGVAQAQQPGKVHRIGLLISASSAATAPFIDAFQQGLRELGYVEGKNIAIERRFAELKFDRLPDLAAELVGLKVDIIVAGGSNLAVRAAKQAASTIPIIIIIASDPVESGHVASLARPGGNITGFTSIAMELIGKHLELIVEAVPRAKRVAVLTATRQLDSWRATDEYKEMEAAARVLGVKLQLLTARDPDTIDNAFTAITKERAEALVVGTSPRFFQNRAHIVKQAAKHRLPSIYPHIEYVNAGGLMSYGANRADLFRRAATHVDKILKGSKPADLPVEQPTKFEFIINLKAAKQIGLTIPPNLLARADRVIR
jgi:putative ABC transport system substrate-binding protein